MKARVQLIFPPQIAPRRIEEYAPENPECFGLRIQAFIGPLDEESVDSFDFTVCSPSWFGGHYQDLQRLHSEPDGTLVGHGLVFMKRWNAEDFLTLVHDVCGQAEGRTWGEVASRIHRVLPWEYVGHYDAAVDAGEPFPSDSPG